MQAGRKTKSNLTTTTLEGPGVPVYFLMLFKIFHTPEDLVAGVAHISVKLVFRVVFYEMWSKLISCI